MRQGWVPHRTITAITLSTITASRSLRYDGRPSGPCHRGRQARYKVIQDQVANHVGISTHGQKPAFANWFSLHAEQL